jgi:hypothetical protein
MPPSTTTLAEFEVLLRRAGLTALPPEEWAACHAVWGAVEEMLARVRTTAPGADEVAAAAAEPSVTFSATEAGR